MPRRDFRLVEARGERFMFFLDGESEELHITRRHGTTDADAVSTFFEAGTTSWNEERLRWESLSETHLHYWTRCSFDGSVLVITCLRREDVDG
jgi:hypothetical protein